MDLQVKDVWDNGSWCLDNLVTSIPTEVLDIIQQIPIPIVSRISYIWSWNYSLDGCYSIVVGYSFLLEQANHITSSHPWRWIWKTSLPEKVKILIWQSLHNALPSNDLRHHIHLSSSSACPRWSNTIESPIHCMRDCPHSLEIWSSFIFYDVPWPITQVLRSINLWISEFIVDDQTPLKSVDSRLVRWLPPVHDSVKVNVDGSCISSICLCGAGGLIRDCQGNWITGFSANAGKIGIVAAELFAIRQGLLISSELGFHTVWCESDSKEVVRLCLLQDSSSSPSCCYYS
ncbi:Ribonuclease H-like superfamily [Sesbania bispinosa]|nr:Ribonuclease H-like superfamily [Sesbania bispinosa]